MVKIEVENGNGQIIAKNAMPWDLCADLMIAAEHAIRKASEITADVCQGLSKEELQGAMEESVLRMLEYLAENGIIRAKNTG